MRALKITTGHVIYNPAYTNKFQLKPTMVDVGFVTHTSDVCPPRLLRPPPPLQPPPEITVASVVSFSSSG